MRWQDTSYLKFLITYHVTRLVPHDFPKFQTGSETDLEMSPKLHREASVKRFRMFVSVSVFSVLFHVSELWLSVGWCGGRGGTIADNIVAAIERGKLMWHECGSGYKNDPGAQWDQWLLAVNLSCLLQRIRAHTHTLTHTRGFDMHESGSYYWQASFS